MATKENYPEEAIEIGGFRGKKQEVEVLVKATNNMESERGLTEADLERLPVANEKRHSKKIFESFKKYEGTQKRSS